MFVEEINLVLFLSGIFSTVGAFFLVRSILKSSAHDIASVSGTYIGSNPHQQRALVQQKSDTLVGFVLVFFAGFFASVGTAVELNVMVTVYNILILLLSVPFIGGVANWFGKMYRNKVSDKVQLVSFAQHVEAYLRNPDQFNAEKLVEDAKKQGLNQHFEGIEDPYECLEICLCKADANPGADLIKKMSSNQK